jgi:hypothetical protein
MTGPGVLGQVHHPQPRVRLGAIIEDPAAAVRRGVVDRDDFDVGPRRA